jgi:probable HAF family extracellular repeat protein
LRRWPAAVALAALVAGPAPAPAQVLYTIQDLGPGVGNAINASGQVAGTLDTGSFQHAARTSATGGFSDPGADLGTLPGDTSSFAFGINAAGQVTGYSTRLGGLPHAFRTTATGLVSDPGADLGVIGGGFSSGSGINIAGQVTGGSTIPTGGTTQHAFRSSANGQPVSLQDLGTLGGANSAGNAINALGVLVGSSDVAGGGSRAFVYDTQMRDLNLLIPAGSGWVLTAATGINDLGQITGSGTINGQTHAFRLTPVPEPSALALAGGALAAAWAARGRVRRTGAI